MNQLSLKKLDKATGFTLIELLIATTVFSVIILIIVYAFLFVSDDYIKGSVQSQTQEAARAAISVIAQDIELNNGTYYAYPSNTKADGGYCIGNDQYSYQTGDEIGSSTITHALVVTPVQGCNNYPTIIPQSLTGTTYVQGKEFLSDYMRLTEFSILPVTGINNFYAITIGIAYGDLAPTGPLTLNSNGTYSCPSLNVGGDFCATSTLTADVQQRVVGQIQ